DDQLLDNITLKSDEEAPRSGESIDELLCHRWFGLGFFFALMFAVFYSIYTLAGPFMDGIEGFFGWLGGLASPLLEGAPMLRSLVVDGIIGGVGGVVVFLPQIFILFFFIGLLEDTGYMARAAYLMDKLFSWCGLNGKCFIPLLSSYACAIPGILSARTIDDPKARLATILVAPLMSCSARLPVYVLFIAAFVQPVYGEFVAGLTLFLMHFVGLAVAAPLVWVLNRFVLKTPPQPFLLEMPRYRVPRVKDLVLRMWLQGREFLVNAGTVIFAFSIIIWALLYFPHPDGLPDDVTAEFVEETAAEQNVAPASIVSQLEEDEELAATLDNRIAGAYLEQSLLGRFGQFVQPVFAPAGFDWKLTVGVLASFPAREVIISTLGIIYNLGSEVDEESIGLREKLENARWERGDRAGQPVYTIPVAVALMVFFALCMQCGATVATIARETSWGWAAFSFFGNTAVAWVAAVVCYQVGSLIL
ncbi:MAG: ferrous iron transporter B, partial [Opitutales bacterium]